MQPARPDRRRPMVHSAYGKNLASRQASANRKRPDDSARESGLRQVLILGRKQGPDVPQEEMTYGDTPLQEKRKKQGYGLDRTPGTWSFNEQPDDYALFGLGRDQADNKELAIWFPAV